MLRLRVVTCQGHLLVFLCLQARSNNHKSCISAGRYWSHMKSSGKTAADFAEICDHLQQRKVDEKLRFALENVVLQYRNINDKKIVLLGVSKKL